MTKQTVPGPKGLPFIGVANQFSENPPVYMTRLAAEYGDVVNFILFGQNSFLIADPDDVREVLISKRDVFPKSKRNVEILTRFVGDGLLATHGETHARQRKLAQPAFHAARIRAYADTMVDYTLQRMARWQHGEVRDISEEMMELTMYIVCKTLFDADMDSMATVAKRAGAAIEQLQETSNEEFQSPIQWPLWIPTPTNRQVKRARAVLNEIINQLVAERRATAGENGRIHDAGDLLSMLLLAQDDEGERMSADELRDQLVTLFVAGHETTSNALTWTWYLLSQHPHVADRLHEEVDRVLGDRRATFADLADLSYTEMVLKESMRLYPPAWTLSARQASEDTTIGDVAIPKDSLVFIAPYVLHRNPAYFPKPEQFDPERFAPEREQQLPRYGYLPFGGGPRVCIGNNFAMMEAQLIIATIAQRFHLYMVPEQQIELNPQVTLSNKHGMRMRIEERRKKVNEVVVGRTAVPA